MPQLEPLTCYVPTANPVSRPRVSSDTRTAGDLRVVRSRLGGSFAKLARGAFPTGELVELVRHASWPEADKRVPASRSSLACAPALVFRAGVLLQRRHDHSIGRVVA